MGSYFETKNQPSNECKDFIEFEFNGKKRKMYKETYIKLRSKQIQDKKPNKILDAFKKYMDDASLKLIGVA